MFEKLGILSYEFPLINIVVIIDILHRISYFELCDKICWNNRRERKLKRKAFSSRGLKWHPSQGQTKKRV